MKLSKLKLGFTVLVITATVGVVGYIYNDSIAAPVQNFDYIGQYEKIEKTKDGLINYQRTIDDKIKELEKEADMDENILVTITFKKPLDSQSLVDIVNDYGLNVIEIKGRAINVESGLKATIGIAPQNGKLYDKTQLEFMTIRSGSEFKGFIEMAANVHNSNLNKLKSHTQVFLADPSGDEFFVSNPQNDTMPGVFWNLEENRMVIE